MKLKSSSRSNANPIGDIEIYNILREKEGFSSFRWNLFTCHICLELGNKSPSFLTTAMIFLMSYQLNRRIL